MLLLVFLFLLVYAIIYLRFFLFWFYLNYVCVYIICLIVSPALLFAFSFDLSLLCCSISDNLLQSYRCWPLIPLCLRTVFASALNMFFARKPYRSVSSFLNDLSHCLPTHYDSLWLLLWGEAARPSCFLLSVFLAWLYFYVCVSVCECLNDPACKTVGFLSRFRFCLKWTL